jgi:hypothetical protein
MKARQITNTRPLSYTGMSAVWAVCCETLGTVISQILLI